MQDPIYTQCYTNSDGLVDVRANHLDETVTISFRSDVNGKRTSITLSMHKFIDAAKYIEQVWEDREAERLAAEFYDGAATQPVPE